MENGIIIRSAEKEDVRQIAEILVEDWQTAYRGVIDSDYLDAMSVDGRYEIEVRRYDKYVVAAEGSRILGYAWLEAADDGEADCEIIALYVLYAERNEARKFYEKAGGKTFRTGTHPWGNKDYEMISYLYDLG